MSVHEPDPHFGDGDGDGNEETATE